MRTNKLLQSIFVLSLLFLFVVETQAQSITTATIRESVEFWTPLQNPTFIGQGDDPWALLTMPFIFSYDNQNITSLYVYNNGYLKMNGIGNPSGYAIPAFASSSNIVYWYGKDLITNGTLSFKVDGAAPFRTLTVQQTGARFVTDNTGATFDVQIKLFETTNEISIIYGNSLGIGGGNVNGYLGFTGSSAGNYINIKPNAPEVASTIYTNTTIPNTLPWIAKSLVNLFPMGRAFTYSTLPKLSGIFPDNNTVLANGSVYTGTQHPFVRISRTAGQKDVGIKYKITGPIGTPGSKVIYTALNAPDTLAIDTVKSNPQVVGNQIQVKMPYAKGIAGRLSDGALDLTDKINCPSGTYEVEAALTYLDNTPLTQIVKSQFKIAYPNDLGIVNISSPIDTNGSIYSLSSQVPIKVRVKNFGTSSVKEFILTAIIYDQAGNTIKTTTLHFKDSINPLVFNEFRDFDMVRFLPQAVGVYKIAFTITNPIIMSDDSPSDNVFPRLGAYAFPNYMFEVGYEIEAQPVAMLTPLTSNYNNRPIRFSARINNNGVSDLTNVPCTMNVTLNGNVVYNEQIIITDIPSGIVKSKIVFWPKIFIPTQTGSYAVKITVNAEGDEVPSNNIFGTSFTVIDGMSGTYKIAQTGGQFKTITESVSALYERGVAGPVTFWLSDAVYNEGNILFNTPAVDMSSKIIGVSATNKITYTIDPEKNFYSYCQINLLSAAGIGFKIAQNSYPTDVKAAVMNVDAGNIKNYSNSDGFITFDGGTKKALVFTMKTSSPFRSVFYLGDGASNVTIKNVVIKDGLNQASSLNCRLPLSVYDPVMSKFSYEPNMGATGTFSAGVLLRSVAPLNISIGDNTYFIDTLTNTKNVVENCEISNFGYGIVSLGLGALINDGKIDFQKYYNSNNLFTKNKISDVSKAGIFLGFEDNTEVSYNRIYNVNGLCDANAAGISIGGDARTGYFGYNNTNITISANEISYISGINNLYGIKVEQSRIDLLVNDIRASYPDVAENVRIINNNIWSFTPSTAATNLIGILLMTERKSGLNWATLTFDPKLTDYFTRNDMILNNTIYLSNDLLDNTGALANVAILNSKSTKIYNNALNLDDNLINDANTVATNVFYYGIHPTKNGTLSDRNVYWNRYSKGSIFRFIEVDAKGKILEPGFKNEFTVLSQWQAWTKLDNNSVYGNFTTDYTTVGDFPFTFRPIKNPTQFNSILNNRGLSMAENQKDIDGTLRGLAGERFDVGCAEFQGRVLNHDLEVVNILEPLKYKSSTGMPFNDAEYIMTTAPVNVKATIRNNGSLPLGNGSVVLKIYRQSTTNSWVQEGPDYKSSIDELQYSDSKLVDFGLANGINNPPVDYEFFPKTYGDLRNDPYVIPAQFISMKANITPLYKFVIAVPNDEINGNNSIEKIIRFYIRKSPIKLLISGENLQPYTIASKPEIIASNLNVDSLVAGFKALGWRIDLNLEDPKTDIDIFDRKVWEPRSIDYTIYRSLFWADGHDTRTNPTSGLIENSTLSRYDRDHITNFLNAGSVTEKKNFIMGSQEIVNNEYSANAAWLKTVLNAGYATPNNPLGGVLSYNGKDVLGLSLGKDVVFNVKSTSFTNDNAPIAGLFDLTNAGFGNSRIGFKYLTHYQDVAGSPVPDPKRISAITTSSIYYNTIHIGTDWRHWAKIEKVLRAIIDYANFEGGIIVPVEILTFDATPVGKRIDVSWSTASETNSSHFEIEKSTVAGNFLNYNSIERISSRENSSVTSQYGPYIDNNVDFGKTYAYRLKMVDKTGDFNYSEVKFATLTSENGVMTLSEVVPNPANTNSTIEFTLSETSNVKLTVYDLNGNEVALIFEGTKVAGTYHMNINSTNFANGTYTIALTNGGNILTTKLNVVK